MGIENLFNISGKVAVVTGAASGLGSSIAEAMAETPDSRATEDIGPKAMSAEKLG
jgi:NAD(P)-dependent dehydrogenase (short-subunit alcohol dehydrogenase family)